MEGFAKAEYPGVTHAQGDPERIEDFVQKLKAMPWLALIVRFVEPLKNNNHTGDHRETKRYHYGKSPARPGVLKTSPSPLPSKHASESVHHLYGK